ncbi:MAG: T9SS type A sorting domain-containing protein [Chitinophagaceae bacterium]
MRHSLISAIAFLFMASCTFAQDPCVTVRVQSPVVAKPASAQSVFTGNCNEVRISWKGNERQTYFVNGAYTDQLTGSGVAAKPLSDIVCDKGFNCSVRLAVKPGNTLSWSIQAMEIVNGRTFYSYPLRGEYEGCETVAVVKTGVTSASKPLVSSNAPHVRAELMVYPNPATGEVIVRWNGTYNGLAKITIYDASGKAVKQIDVRKEQVNYLDRVAVNALSPGLYLLNITMQQGQNLSAKFVKK